MSRVSVKGLIEARKAFQALPENTREALLVATEETVGAVKLGAVQRVPVWLGVLRNHIGTTFSKRSGFGKVGLVSETVTIADGQGEPRTVNAAKYGPLVEHGTSRTEAQPFMLPAAESQRVAYAQRLKAAGRRLEQRYGNGGGRLL